MDWEKERLLVQKKLLSGHFDFEEQSLKIFQLQYQFNPVYHEYLHMLRIRPEEVRSCKEIPCLPIQFFKYRKVQTGIYLPEKIFQSSGTTGMQRSMHRIRSLEWYKKIAAACFAFAFSPDQSGVVEHLAYLPSYMDNADSSLLYMVQSFIDSGMGGFYHDRPVEFVKALSHADVQSQQVIWGVSYALYQWQEPLMIRATTIMIETGGMKGRGREMTRQEVHSQLRQNFGLTHIFSEYGMTEMMSQAYTNGVSSVFQAPPVLKVFPRSLTDPLAAENPGQTAALNVIDLANLDSCCFIATEDLGKVYPQGTFEVSGRLDNSDIRGCNLLIS